jgi:type IV fimbrial biogenesis protein FimT
MLQSWFRQQDVRRLMQAPVLRRQRGVTLVELLVTMSILVILLTVGVSGMTTLVKRNTRATEVNTMVGHLNYARAQAVLRATDIAVCPVDTSDLAGGCSGGTEDWVDGYAVVQVSDGEVLRVEGGSAVITMRSTVKVLRFQDDGTLAGIGANITFCDVNDDSSDDSSRSNKVIKPVVVIIANTGRVRVSEQTGSGLDPNCS